MDRLELIKDLFLRLEGIITTEQKGEFYHITVIKTDKTIVLNNESDIALYLQAICNTLGL